jgi:hypothetical protein
MMFIKPLLELHLVPALQNSTDLNVGLQTSRVINSRAVRLHLLQKLHYCFVINHNKGILCT